MFLVMFEKDTRTVTSYRMGLPDLEVVSCDHVKWDDGELRGMQRGFAILSFEEGEFLLNDYPDLMRDSPIKDRKLDEDGEELKDPILDEELALRDIKRSKRKEISDLCEASIKRGFWAGNGHFYEFDDKDQANFNQQIAEWMVFPEMLQDEDYRVEWKTEDNGVMYFTIEEFKEVLMAASLHKRTYVNQYRQLKEIIENADTWNEIASVEWEG